MDSARRRVYFAKRSLEEARAEAVACARETAHMESETLPVVESLGRVVAEPVVARFSVPVADVAAMDGIAIDSASVLGASESKLVVLPLGDNVRLVDTGQPIPGGCNAVVMIEYADVRDDGTVALSASVQLWQHVRLAGEDIAAGETLLDEGTRIRPVDLGAVLAVGVTEIAVRCRPTVGILPTGDELVAPGTKPEPGQLIEFNSAMLAGMVSEWGGVPVVYPAVKDEPDLLRDAVAESARDCSVLLIIGGSSAGRRDFVQQTIALLGEVRVEAVAIAPGKPTAIGVIDGTPVLGMPGYPVSCIVAAQQFLHPIIATLLRAGESVPGSVQTRFARKVPSKLGREEFLRVRLNPRQAGDYIARPMPRGAGAVTSVVHADAVVRIPSESEGVRVRQNVWAELLRPVAHNLVLAGCWDPAIDLLGHRLRDTHPELTVVRDHIGSMAGIDALCRGETQYAVCAVPIDDENNPLITGDLMDMLNETDQALEFVAICRRVSGFIVPPGNPKDIRGFADLVRPDIMFANRRRGSTTRHMLDSALAEQGIDHKDIAGYTREQKTDIAAAAAVRENIADTTLGTAAAADRLGLDLVAAGKETVFLVAIDKAHHPLHDLICQTLADISYQDAVNNLTTGHNASVAGTAQAKTDLIKTPSVS